MSRIPVIRFHTFDTVTAKSHIFSRGIADLLVVWCADGGGGRHQLVPSGGHQVPGERRRGQ
jgi:hypothetical protein